MSDAIREVIDREYEFGFEGTFESEVAPKGLSEEIVRFISARKQEPDWLLEWRLAAYRHFLTLEQPTWPNLEIPPIDYQDMHYWAAPKPKGPAPKSLDEVDPEVRAMFDKLGIPLSEQERLSGVAVDAIVDSVSVATTFKARLAEAGVIFCSFSEAVREHPGLVRPHLGSVVGPRDNFFAALNAAVFSDGSFCYVPAGVTCPMELSTYFRMNAAGTGQFERTLIVAEEGATVSYLEGCTAPMRDENQLHAAVVELIARTDARIKGGLNWSSQHLDDGGVGDGNDEGAPGGGPSVSGGYAFAGPADGGVAAGSVGVLGGDRQGREDRRRVGGGGCVVAGRLSLVPSRWRGEPLPSIDSVGSLPVVLRARGHRAVSGSGPWRARDRTSGRPVAVDDQPGAAPQCVDEDVSARVQGVARPMACRATGPATQGGEAGRQRPAA